MIKFNGKTIRVHKNQSFEVEYDVAKAVGVKGRVVVLYNPDSVKRGQFRNLVAFSDAGEKIWEAELPTTMSSDCYYDIFSIKPLVVGSFCSFRCTIDLSSGKIIEKEFCR